MNNVIQAIKENALTKEYLALTEAIADIDEQLKAVARKSWWQGEEDVLSPKEKTMLRAERMLLAKALMDVTGRINGAAEFETSGAQVGITVDLMLPAKVQVEAEVITSPKHGIQRAAKGMWD